MLLLIVLVVATCYLLSEGEYIPGVATSILAVGRCFRVVWNVRSVNRKLAYFFQALENDDYSIHFPEYGGSHSERFLNGVLNRIKDILQNTDECVKVIEETIFDLMMEEPESEQEWNSDN